jgi:serine/threonine-protein kinase
MLQAGETLAGYRIEAIAGVGGMGVVYRATQLSLERRVALKVLSTTLVGNHRFRERFRLEGRHAAALDHPNIIPVYEAGESNGLMFIAMRFVDGPTLADMVTQQSLTGRDTLRILTAIASALDAAHESGLVHRDVKPHNILMTGGGHPYLADFGITKGAQASGLTHSGDFVGSVAYVAPEQIDGRDVTAQSDIYSLTAVLFHCLTGTLPYDHDTEAALMHAHLFAPPPTMIGLGIDAPRALDELIARGMAKSPTDRFSSATELIEGCARVLPDAALDRTPPLAPGVSFSSSGAEPQVDPWARDSAAPAPAAPAFVPDWGAPAPAPPPAVADQAFAPAGGMTAADRRPEAPAAAPARAGPRFDVPGVPWADMKVPALILAGILAVIGAPLLGYVLGKGDDSSGPPVVRSQASQVSYAPPWEPSGATIPGLGVDGAVGLRRSDGMVLVAGRLRDPSPGFDPAPASLRDKAARELHAVRIRLGDRDGIRYAVPLRAGGSLWMVAFPDTKGWSTVACTATSGRPDAACATVAATMRSRTAKPIALGGDKRAAEGLDRVIRRLNRARASARPRIASRSTATRARGFRGLARADLSAARSLGNLKLGPQEAALFAAAVTELRAEAKVLGSLAGAARDRRRAAYERGRESLQAAERRLQAAVGGP